MKNCCTEKSAAKKSSNVPTDCPPPSAAVYLRTAMKTPKTQHFRKLLSLIVYGNIKTRYNVFRKYANDVFGAGNNPSGLV